MMEMEVVERMKVAELRSMLAERGLEESGKKADLVERLKEAMAFGQERGMLDVKHTKDNSKEGPSNGKEGTGEEEEEPEDSEDSENEEEEASKEPEKTAEG